MTFFTLRYAPDSLRNETERWLRPYGFYSFNAKRHEAADIITVQCLWKGSRTYDIYKADFPAVCLIDPPWQCVDPLAAWVELHARSILQATWGKGKIKPPVGDDKP
jgi:hypothetical protein